ncbi:glycosyltransferase family 1 protein [Rahnella sp. CJA17(1/100)]|jgi:glycosyltransferase involved in cell wall biosynthesis|nr:glycosyltransferase family 1 protein [Rahnella sp. CJA17(1/100)]AZP43596.1 glycosyltransferase family 4 protein [Rahnella aquatilis]AZP47933.1 glycosyltransferase family 4 protein [Rahnella aquatilis]
MIYVNGRFLTQNITGVQRFAEEISLELIKIRSDVIFLVPDLNAVKKKELLNVIKIEEVCGLSGHLWEQITLPLYLYKNKRPLLINLCNTAPVSYPNQIVTHHDITYLKFPKSFPFSFRLLYRLIAPLILKNSKHIITVSDFSKKEIVTNYRCPLDKISVIPNAYSDIFKPYITKTDLQKKENYLLAVSSTNFHKNFHGLIDAFLSADIDMDLKIIGGSADVFKKLELDQSHPRIHFMGRVDDDQLVALYQNANAFVFPSFYEGFGIPPLEAQACGCPVISSNSASMPEVLGDSVLYFNPQSKSEIVKALELIADNHELRNKLVTYGFKNIKRFSWVKSANKLNNIIQNFNG